jgi:hypothetical protein
MQKNNLRDEMMRDNFGVYRELLNLPDAIFLQTEYEGQGRVSTVYRVVQKTIETQFILKICHRPQDYAHEVYFLEKFANVEQI